MKVNSSAALPAEGMPMSQVMSQVTSQISSQVSIWLERRFEFSFTQELYPNPCVRPRGAPAWRNNSRLSPGTSDPPATSRSGPSRNVPAVYWILSLLGPPAGMTFWLTPPHPTAADLKRQTHAANHHARELGYRSSSTEEPDTNWAVEQKP
jgi:hypothetical protein